MTYKNEYATEQKYMLPYDLKLYNCQVKIS